jgi:hypothetical protein
MAKPIPLPRYEELPEVVLFHRSHPASPRLLLQVPTGPDTSETYLIDMAQPPAPVGEYDPRTDHKGWVERLPGGRALMDKLACDMHVAYYHSRNGTSMVLEDPDQIPWVRQIMAMARIGSPDVGGVDAYFNRRSRQVAMMQPSPLRRSLATPRFGGASW